MKLPAPSYWFSNAALASAGVVGLGLAMGLVQVRPMVPDSALRGFGIIGAVLVGLVWHAGAQQAQDAATAQRSSQAILRNIADLVTSRQDRDERVDWGRPSGLSNAQLRDAALSLSSQMRVFEAGAVENRGQVGGTMRYAHGLNLSPEEARQRWLRHQAEQDRLRGAVQREYMTRFQSKAKALYEEMNSRLGIIGRATGDDLPVLLERGMMAGPSPIQEAANYLEKLARRLP